MQKQEKNQEKLSGLSLIEDILERGEVAEVRNLFGFDKDDTNEDIRKRFNFWARWFFPKYFKSKDAPFHRTFDEANIAVYRGEIDFVNAGFRGCAKDTRTKLFLAYAVLNDIEHTKKYIKVLTGDIANGKQIVTDIYNMAIDPRVNHYYPEIFGKTIQKREETMSSFTTATGVKVSSGTLGMEQRGDIQEDARPDLIFFNDFETRKTLRSPVLTKAIFDNMEEARTGLAKGGGSIYACNYLSERGNVHKLIKGGGERRFVLITPIIQDGKPTWPDAYTLQDIKHIESEADDFEGEYLSNPSVGADVFFDRESLKRQVAKKPIKVSSGFKMFYPFNPSHRYGSGHDVAGGVGLDSSTSCFIDFSTIPARVVATYTDNTIKPDVFGDEIARQAGMFGEPIVAPENNSLGQATIGRLKQIYDNIFTMEMMEGLASITPKKVQNYG